MKKQLKITYKAGYSTTYEIVGTRKRFNISASANDKLWTNPGKVFLKLKDNGNGLVISLNGEILSLDYWTSELLRIALKINSPEAKLKEIEKQTFKGLK